MEEKEERKEDNKNFIFGGWVGGNRSYLRELLSAAQKREERKKINLQQNREKRCKEKTLRIKKDRKHKKIPEM